jgi:uncharacterized protein YcbK (DUF882 family)
MNRRRLLAGGLGAAACLALPGLAGAGVQRLHETRFSGIGQTHLWVKLWGRGEEEHVRLRTLDGLLIREGVERLSWLWRDWRDGDRAVWCDYRLFDVLAWMQTAASIEDDRPVRVVLTSGYRTPERNARIPGASPVSQHLHGRAADFYLDGLDHERVATLAERAGAGGVGRYPTFTHIDTGREQRRWHG